MMESLPSEINGSLISMFFFRLHSHILARLIISATVLESVWILGVPDCMGGLFSLFALPSLEWQEDGWAFRMPPQNEHPQERLTPNLFSTKPPCRRKEQIPKPTAPVSCPRSGLASRPQASFRRGLGTDRSRICPLSFRAGHHQSQWEVWKTEQR